MTPENFALTMYSLASVGHYDNEFFENAIHMFEESRASPSLQNLGYIV
jgi:hypothetical protein